MKHPLTSFRLASAAAAASLTSGCLSTGPALTMIETDPPGAIVRVEGFGECTSPCTIEHDRDRRITIAKAGYRKIEMVVSPGARRVRAPLELAAPSGAVEADALPPID